jgi:hypothetical protein
MPPGYGYLTRHLPHRATHTRLSGSTSRQASPSDQNEEETWYYTQIPRCSGLDSHNEQTPALKVPLQTELRFHSRGFEQPPHQRACGTTNSGWLAVDRCTNSAATTSVSDGKTAAAMALGRTLPLEGPRSRPLAGDENQPLKPKSRRPGAQVALTVSSAEKPSPAATTSAPTTAATCPPTPHQRAPAAQSAPAGPHSRSRRENENETVPEHEYCPRGVRRVVRPPGAADHSRPDEGRNAAPWPGSSSSPSPAWLEDASSAELEDGFLPRMPEGEASRRAMREVEPRLTPPSSPARMMKILEAEGGAEAAARLASPHYRTGGHRPG